MKLENLFNSVLEVQDNLSLNIIAYDNVLWEYYDGEVIVNVDKNEEDFYNRDGSTYSFEVRGRVDSEDGYVKFYDADNGCGTKDTLLFKRIEEC